MWGGVHGSEHLSAGLLIRYAADYCAGVEDGGKMYSLSMKYLFENRTLYIVPMLNPDGVEIAIHGRRPITPYSTGSCVCARPTALPGGRPTRAA